MSKRRSLVAIIALVTAALLVTVVYANLSKGTKAPNFTLPTVKGKSFTLSNCFKSPRKVVVLDLWATWCPPCKAEIPYLIKLHNKYTGKGAMVVGVSLDSDKAKAVAYAKEKGIKYTVPLDPKGDKLGESYKIRGIPVTYVIDKKGMIRYVHSGFPRDEAQQKKEAAKMESEVEKLLAEK